MKVMEKIIIFQIFIQTKKGIYFPYLTLVVSVTTGVKGVNMFHLIK